MVSKKKYGIPSLKRDFPDDKVCLEYIFDILHSRKCLCGGKYSIMRSGTMLTKKLQCSKCRFKISPTTGTIFHKSRTPLNLWFHAILVFSNAKSGISARQMQRNLEVTYKCAYRILSIIRKTLKQDSIKLKGDVEMDTGYFGGKGYGGKYNKYQKDVIARKSVVTIAVERGGKAKAEVVLDTTADTIQSFIQRNIESTCTSLITDEGRVYWGSDKTHDRYSVNHSKGEYVREDIHINTVETFISHLKRSMRGTFKVVSKQHLQSYLDAFVFHYNNRHNDNERFSLLVQKLLASSEQKETVI